jgi:hypothetical protein
VILSHRLGLGWHETSVTLGSLLECALGAIVRRLKAMPSATWPMCSSFSQGQRAPCSAGELRGNRQKEGQAAEGR